MTPQSCELLSMVSSGGPVPVEYAIAGLWDAVERPTRREQQRRQQRLRAALCRLNKGLTGQRVVRQGGALRLVRGEGTAVERCAAALKWYLASGPRPVADVAVLLGDRFSEGTIKRARRLAGVKAFRVGGWGGRWFVRLAD